MESKATYTTPREQLEQKMRYATTGSKTHRALRLALAYIRAQPPTPGRDSTLQIVVTALAALEKTT